MVGVDRFNQAGGAVMDDFDNDGLLDLAVTSFDPDAGDGVLPQSRGWHLRGPQRTTGVLGQLGGLVCYQTDYNNDGRLDLFIPRGAWYPFPMRPSLLRNNGDGTSPTSRRKRDCCTRSTPSTACWADYDNDGWLDLFIGCEQQPNRLYHNRGDGTFEDVAAKAGVDEKDRTLCKGATWIDFDNDDYPDLFLNNLSGDARAVSATIATAPSPTSPWPWASTGPARASRAGPGTTTTTAGSTSSPPATTIRSRTWSRGCWASRTARYSNRLFHNMNGKGFEDKTKEAGLDMVFATMGSNFGDFDNDGFLDFYLGTGDPNLATLVPNRMFKNVAGRRFAEITGTSGTGHLQKGHGVACGDWDRDGDVDLFIEMGGAINGDKYHNILFQNPGQGNHWLTVKLVGKKTNRAAIGARIKVVTAGEKPLTIHRHISSGSSFGANPLQQTIGLGKAERVASLEIHWPTSGTTQVFRDIAANQAIEVTEFAQDYRKLSHEPTPLPE